MSEWQRKAQQQQQQQTNDFGPIQRAGKVPDLDLDIDLDIQIQTVTSDWMCKNNFFKLPNFVWQKKEVLFLFW